MTALPPAQGAPVSNRPGPYLSHSQQGPGHGHLDTAHTWVQPPQAYRSIARSSAHSHPAQHPRGHNCRLRGRGWGRHTLRSVSSFPIGPRAWPSPARCGPDQSLSKGSSRLSVTG